MGSKSKRRGSEVKFPHGEAILGKAGGVGGAGKEEKGKGITWPQSELLS